SPLFVLTLLLASFLASCWRSSCSLLPWRPLLSWPAKISHQQPPRASPLLPARAPVGGSNVQFLAGRPPQQHQHIPQPRKIRPLMLQPTLLKNGGRRIPPQRKQPPGRPEGKLWWRREMEKKKRSPPLR